MDVADAALPEPTSSSSGSNLTVSEMTAATITPGKPENSQPVSSPESKNGSTITANSSASSSTPTGTVSVVAPGAMADPGAGQQQYLIVSMPVMSADGRTIQGVSTGIVNATASQVGGTVLGTVVQQRPVMAGVPATTVVGQAAVVAKGRVVPARGPQTRATVGVVKAGTVPRSNQAIVPRATQPTAAGQPAVVKMMSVVQPSGITLQAPGAAALVRRTSPTKAPVKQVVNSGGRTIAVRPAGAVGNAVAGTSNSNPIIVGPSVVKKPAPVRTSVPNQVVSKPVVKPAPGPAVAVVKLPPQNKNLASSDRALQYRRAVSDSQAKLRKLEAVMAKASPDRATPFSVAEIFSQAAASFCKLSSLTSHISLESSAPREQRVWTPELITKFFGVIQTAAAGLKEVGDELKKTHEKRISENLKRKSENEGGLTKKVSPDAERAPVMVNGAAKEKTLQPVASSSSAGQEPSVSTFVPQENLPNGVAESTPPITVPVANADATTSSPNSDASKSDGSSKSTTGSVSGSVRVEDPSVVMREASKEEAHDAQFQSEDMEHVDIQETETVVDSDVVLEHDGIIPHSESNDKSDGGAEMLGERPLEEVPV